MAKPVRSRSEQQINNWSVRELGDNLKEVITIIWMITSFLMLLD